MTIALDIINGIMPDFDRYLKEGNSLEDIDEYGFTLLVECAITRQLEIAQQLIKYKVDVNHADLTGRTALHWAVDNNDEPMARLLLENGANANAYTTAGLSILVYPVLRDQNSLKLLLYQFGANLDFAMDFILAKLIGHRYELQGDVDIVNGNNQFIELDYEGFMLEFTVAMLHDSLKRFTSSYSTRKLRKNFSGLYPIISALIVSGKMLKLQHSSQSTLQKKAILQQFVNNRLLVLPVASRGHAFCFVKYRQWWAKIDRGENSLKEACITIYQINHPEEITSEFLFQFIIKKQSRTYFHKQINQLLGLVPVATLPISAQTTGNCSWANVEAIILVAYALQTLKKNDSIDSEKSNFIYYNWIEWDKDRALDECIHRFYLASDVRKASIAAILAGVLYQACNYNEVAHLERAEKILAILTLPKYYYVLRTYLDAFCVRKLTRKGNNLLKILEYCGIDPNIDVNPIATDF